MKEITRESLEAYVNLIIENLNWEGMEAYLWNDGSSGYRQKGSTGTAEEEIIHKEDLSESSWSDHWIHTEEADLEDPEVLEAFKDELMPAIEDYSVFELDYEIK